jgi:hypothetical protein
MCALSILTQKTINQIIFINYSDLNQTQKAHLTKTF